MQIFIDPNIDLRRLILHEQEYNDVQQCLSTGWENKKYEFFFRFCRFFAIAQNSQTEGFRVEVLCICLRSGTELLQKLFALFYFCIQSVTQVNTHTTTTP